MEGQFQKGELRMIGSGFRKVESQTMGCIGYCFRFGYV